MTFLPTGVAGRWFYLYLILDLYSRKIVGWEVHDCDSADHAAHLVRRTALAEGIHAAREIPFLHGDNGVTLKATTVLAMLYWLGIQPSYSRPRVSDDNAYAESLFRTAKYRPEFPVRGLRTLMRRVPGRPGSPIGTTSSIGTVASAMSRRSSAIAAQIGPCWRRVMISILALAKPTRAGGRARPEIGRRWAR